MATPGSKASGREAARGAAARGKGPRGKTPEGKPTPGTTAQRKGPQRKAASRRTRVGSAPRGAAPAGSRAQEDGKRLRELRRRLAAALPEPRCELEHRNAWELLVATILSAQSTDARVNRVTPELFRHFPTPAALADAPREAVEELVHSTGFFRNKTKAIQAASRRIADEHGGEVPRDMDAALALPGVARKTANVVLGTAYGLPTGVVVDTHAARVARRLGLSAEKDPARIERELCASFPKRSWVDTGHRLVLHGRYVCRAREPRCGRCPLNELCPSRELDPEGSAAARARWERRLVESRGQADRWPA